MLELIGAPGKSIVAEAMQEYNKAGVIVIGNEHLWFASISISEIPEDINEESVKEIMFSIEKAMDILHKDSSIRWKIIYTNIQNRILMDKIKNDYKGYENCIFMHR